MAKNATDYLNPEVIQQVARLDLQAKFIVEGFIAGLHRSPFHGFSVEFSEHRKYTLGDETQLVELHHVQGLDHVAGMLIAYFPKDKLVVEADLYSPPADGQSPAAPSASNRTFYQNLQRLQLDVETIVPIHGRPSPMSGFIEYVSQD